MPTDKIRSFWTWGFTTDEPSEDRRQNFASTLSQRAGREVAVPVIPTLADAILDRLVHSAYKINLKGESMRKKTAILTIKNHPAE